MVSNWTATVISKLWNFEGSLGEIEFLLRQCLTENATSKEDLYSLAEDLLRAALMTSVPDAKFLECLKTLVYAKFISWSDLINVITKFKDYSKITGMKALLCLLDSEKSNISCCFNDQDSCNALVQSSLELLKWFVNALHSALKYEYSSDYCEYLTSIVLKFVQNEFFFNLLKIGVDKHKDMYEKDIRKTLCKIKEIKSEQDTSIEKLCNILDSVCDPVVFDSKDLIISLCKSQNRSGIKTLTAVFMSERTLVPVVEVAETLINFASIFEYTKEGLLTDIFQATLLVMIDHQNTRYDLKALGLHFFFTKTPKILQYFYDVKFITSETLFGTLKSLIVGFKQELDELDAIFKENSILRLLEGIKVLSESQNTKLRELRDAQIKANVELNHHLLSNPGEIKPLNTIIKGCVMRTSVEKTWDIKDKIDMMVPRFCGSSGILLDSILGTYSADGNVIDLSRRFAIFCREAESENIGSDRSHLFDGYFICLMRLLTFYPLLKLEDIVAGYENISKENLNGIFYRWSSQFILRISSHSEKSNQTNSNSIVVTDEMKRTYRDRILRLQEGEVFWNEQTQTCKELIELVPLIGSIWLEYFKDKKSEQDYLKNTFKNVVFCFNRVSSAIICLSQWLENQEASDVRKTMACSILYGIDEQIRSIPKEAVERSIWPVVKNICNHYLADICNPSLPHPLSITLKSIAIRSFPNCSRLQISDPNILKDCWLYAQRQNWFNHKTLAIIHRCNQAEQHRMWIRIFINNLMRLMAQDVMAKSIEFICAILLLDPIDSILIILEVLFEYLLQIGNSESEDDIRSDMHSKSNEHSADGPGIQHEAPHILPLVKLTVQVMFLGIWLVDFKKVKKDDSDSISDPPEAKKPKLESSSEQDISKLELILPTIRKCIQHMNKEVKQGVFTPAVSAVMHIVKNIAATPSNRCKHILLTLIPPDLVFRMGLADPYAVPYEMFYSFCDPSNPEHTEKRVRYLCMLRSLCAL